MKKKIVSVILTSTMLLSGSAFAYNDISDHWAKVYIENMEDAGVLGQFYEDSIHPDIPISRGECAELISDFLETYYGYIPSINSNIYTFSDLKDGTSQTSKIRSLSRYYFRSHMLSESTYIGLTTVNVINGYPDGSFKPNAQISRAEFAKILISALDCFGYLPIGNTGFYYSDTWGYGQSSDVWYHWGFRPIDIAFGLQIMNGYNKKILDYGIHYVEFRPDSPITRAEAIKMVASARGRQYIGLYGNGWGPTRPEGEKELYYISE